MRTISKSMLKARMLGVFREIEKTGEELIVTDNRQPVIKIVPLKNKRSFDEVFKDYQGRARYGKRFLQSTEKEWGDQV